MRPIDELVREIIEHPDAEAVVVLIALRGDDAGRIAARIGRRHAVRGLVQEEVDMLQIRLVHETAAEEAARRGKQAGGGR